MRVAVVESDEARRVALMRRLARPHLHFDASSVSHETIVDGHFDPATVDVVLLGVDATAASMSPLRWLSHHAPSTAVVALQHRSDVEVGIEIVVTGAQDVLPFAEATAARLDRVVRSAIARKRVEVAALSSAMTDPVTGMASRGWMLQRLDLAVSHAATCAEGWQVVVLFCDLDRFKAVNDALGHAKGDELLKSVAERLGSVVRAEDPVTRFGGDEFVILLEGHRVEALAHRIALRALGAMAAPFEIDGHEVSVLTSIGLAVHRCGESAAELLNHADLALYRAKRLGRSRVEVFDDELRAWSDHQVDLAERLTADLRNDRIELLRTPLWNLAQGSVAGVLTSAAWSGCGEGEGLVDLAARHGLGPDLGRWVIGRSLEDAAGQPSCSGQLVVEIPPGLVSQPSFVGWVADELAARRIDPSRLTLAIAEAELAESELVKPVLDGLDRIGVSVALAGFGSGSSSLALFGSLYVDEVLLAPELVAGIAEDAPRRAVVESLLRIANAIGQRVVATSPSSLADIEVLAELGCELLVSAIAPGGLRTRPAVVVPSESHAPLERIALR
ncbi:MAG: diguanylate cyclase [Microthrixaceae bacterium]|nr:diguanylate cyclase [Microthrixaceae bacterium]